MMPVGYVVREHASRLVEAPGSSVLTRLAADYGRSVLHEGDKLGYPLGSDPPCIGVTKPFHSLQRMAAEARRPIFALRPADGAVGSHALAVQEAYRDYRALALEILRRVGVPAPT